MLLQVLPPPPSPQVVPELTHVCPAQHAPTPLQVWLAQHGSFGPPHATAAPFAQTVPASRLPPVGTQAVEVAQAAPLHGVPLGHGGWSGPPHWAQVLPAPQTRLAWVQAVPVAQHGCPAPPQPAQVPAARQRSPPAQLAPEAMQVRLPTGLQQPLAQAAPPQQGCPGWPHCWHNPLEQAEPAAVQFWPAQHAWPSPPHAVQTLLAQVLSAAEHAPPPQHAWPGPPQGPQVPA